MRFFLIILFSFLLFNSYAQNNSSLQTERAEQLERLAENSPPEIAYIQTSKDIYETGEDLWFKLYLLGSQTLVPSFLSKTLYIQLLYEKNRKIVWQEKYEINKGFADGRIFLDNDLAEGDYLLMAYTANSFFGESSEFTSLRRIKITRNILSRLSFVSEFDKSFYSAYDTIKVKLFPLVEPRDSLVALVEAILRRGNIQRDFVKTKTDNRGRVTLLFRPYKETNEKSEIEINTNFKGNEERFQLPVTNKENPIQFLTFPEGGDLVSGLENKLAFKAVNKNGEPVEIKGKLYEDGLPIRDLVSTHAGMGSLIFIPVKGRKYYIQLSDPLIDSTFILPDIIAEGMSLRLIDRDDESLIFKISQTPGVQQKDFWIMVQCRGIVYSFTKGKINRELKIIIPISDLPQGISEITLYTGDQIPMAERLVYVNSNKKLEITTSLSGETYANRSKITAKIKVKDEEGQPVSASLGISVFDKLYQNSCDSSNILTHYFLSTQLKGRVYNPSFYFDRLNKKAAEALDLLMLTQGWRRYAWNEENLEKLREGRKQIISDGIKGNLYFLTNTKRIPRKQSFVMAFPGSKDSSNVLLPADSSGVFFVTPRLLKEAENDEVFMKPLGPQGYQLTIKMTDPFEIINKEMKTCEISYPVPQIIRSQEKPAFVFTPEPGVTMIKEVTIKGKRGRSERGKYMGILDSIAFANADNDYVCQYGVLNCPRHPKGSPGETKPRIGFPYYVIYLYNTAGEYVREITYWTPRYTDEELLKINNLSKVKGYYGVRKFYQPIYDKDKGDILIPDYRNTLLWAPSVITDENGEATISFYSSDINTEFVGRIEGVSNNGLLGTGSFKFIVRKVILSP